MKMLKFITLALLFSMFMIACGSSENEESVSNDETEEIDANDVEKAVMNAFEKMAEEADVEESANCDEYLDKFEKWADKYIAMLKKVKKNPADATLAMELTKLAPEMSSWANEWSNHIKCSQEEKSVKRYDEITDRIQKAADELE